MNRGTREEFNTKKNKQNKTFTGNIRTIISLLCRSCIIFCLITYIIRLLCTEHCAWFYKYCISFGWFDCHLVFSDWFYWRRRIDQIDSIFVENWKAASKCRQIDCSFCFIRISFYSKRVYLKPKTLRKYTKSFDGFCPQTDESIQTIDRFVVEKTACKVFKAMHEVFPS